MEWVDGLDDASVRALEHGGLPIGTYAIRSACWFLCVSDVDALPEGSAVLRSFAKTGLILAEAAPRLLGHIQPDTVFLLNGLFLAEELIRSEAARRGIRVVTYEHGQKPDTLCLSDGIANHYDITGLWAQVKCSPLSARQEAALDGYLAERRKGFPGISDWRMPTEDAGRLVEMLALDPQRPLAALFTNVTWDSAAQGRDRGFTSMFSWILETISLFETLPDAQLVVRIHPGEFGLKGWESRDPVRERLRSALDAIPPNVRIIPPESPVNSYVLGRLAGCALVYTSTVGLELALEGQPVVVAGEVHYAGKGFTLDPTSPAEYRLFVRTALTTKRDPAVRAPLRARFLYPQLSSLPDRLRERSRLRPDHQHPGHTSSRPRWRYHTGLNLQRPTGRG
jgi:hypothetical protein